MRNLVELVRDVAVVDDDSKLKAVPVIQPANMTKFQLPEKVVRVGPM